MKIKNLEDYKYNQEYRKELKRRLYNYILTAIQAHNITQEDLEEVCSELVKAYKKEAVIPTSEKIVKPLDDIY